MVILFVTGSSTAGSRIEASESRVILGRDDPKTWILVDPRVLGSDYGRKLRQNLPPYSVGLITSTRLPTYLEGDTLIICGTLKKEELQEVDSLATRFHRILLLNPTFYPQELKFDNAIQISAIFGEVSQSSSVNEWKSRLGGQVSILTGIGDFIPKWPALLLNIK